MKDWTTPVLIGVVLIAGFVAVRSISANAVLRAEAKMAKADAVAWQAHGDSMEVVADSLRLVNSALEEETERQRVAVDRIKAESDSILGVLAEERRTVRTARIVSASNFRQALPLDLIPLFDEHEQIHAAELAASEHETGQVQRKFRASEAFVVTQDARIAGLLISDSTNAAGWANERVQSALWKESSDRHEAALNGSWFGNLSGGVTKIAVGVVIGAVLVR